MWVQASVTTTSRCRDTLSPHASSCHLSVTLRLQYEGQLGFQNFAFANKAAVNTHEHQILLLWGTCPGGDLLGHLARACLILWEPARLFQAAVPFAFPLSLCETLLLCIFPNIWCFATFHFSHSDRGAHILKRAAEISLGSRGNRVKALAFPGSVVCTIGFTCSRNCPVGWHWAGPCCWVQWGMALVRPAHVSHPCLSFQELFGCNSAGKVETRVPSNGRLGWP